MMLNICQNDLSSQTGQNIRTLLNLYDIEDLTSLLKQGQTIKKMRVNPLEDDEDWKVNILEELCLAQNGLIELDFNTDEIEMIIDRMATSRSTPSPNVHA